MGLKPLQDWAVIKRLDPEEKTSGGIIIPDTAKDKPSEGVILAIGPGKFETEKGKGKEKKKKKKYVPTTLKPGQTVVFLKYMAKEVALDGEKITLVREEDILGTIEERGVEVRKSFDMESRPERPPAVKKEGSLVSASKEKKPSSAGKTAKKRS